MKINRTIAVTTLAFVLSTSLAAAETTVQESGKLVTSHLDYLKVFAQGHSEEETLRMCADMVTLQHQSKNLLGPLPSDSLKYCEEILE